MSSPMRGVLPGPAARFVDRLLRGVGQVMLQNNPVTGLLFLFGIFVSDWVSGLCALFATAVSTATALWLGAPNEDIDAGLYGFNGALTGVALAVYLQHNLALLPCVLAASMFVSLATAALTTVCGSRCKPLTGPFVITTWVFVGALSVEGQLRGVPALGASHLSADAAVNVASLGLTDAVTAIFNGPAQVMLQVSPWTGAIFLLALAVNSRISCVAAVLGSALGAAIGWGLGATPNVLREGLYGFNAVLTAISLSGVFFIANRHGLWLAVLATCVSTIAYGMFEAVLAPLGLPPLTAPFVAVVWVCLLARGCSPRLRYMSADQPTTAESLPALQQAGVPVTAGDEKTRVPIEVKPRGSREGLDDRV